MAADAPAQTRLDVSADALIHWRREQLRHGGSQAELDWLLELQGGIGWHTIQRLPLLQSAPVRLQATLHDLERLWLRHLQSQEPLQYLVGRCPWRDLELEVGPGVLIPRQETELLVELALSQSTTEPQLWADLGTGSGCLAVALARAWPDSRGIAVDVSDAAIAQARRNLEAQQVLERVMLLEGSWWEPLRPHWGALDLVVANPPYIPEAIWQGLEPVVRDHEPKLALSSGADGLNAIRAIASGARQALAPGGQLLLEHHHDHSAAVLELLGASGLDQCQAHRDLEGKLRFASGRAPSP